MPARSNPRPIENDGTRELLRWGSWIVGTGLLAGLMLQVFFGGYTRLGARTNWGWFSLIVVLGCVPFGSMLLALGIAKWLRNRRIARRGR